MLIRTHIAITLFFILLFIGSVENEIVFVFVALLATLIPDVDSKNSTFGNKKIFRPLQFFIKHRGFVHSFTFLILITFIFVMFLVKSSDSRSIPNSEIFFMKQNSSY